MFDFSGIYHNKKTYITISFDQKKLNCIFIVVYIVSLNHLLSQLGPTNCGRQTQVILFPIMLHVPPFWQGLGWQDCVFTSQVVPVQPEGQVHS